MSDWTNFFVVEAGAPAVLAGLVFVGASINKTVSNPDYGLTGRVTLTTLAEAG